MYNQIKQLKPFLTILGSDWLRLSLLLVYSLLSKTLDMIIPLSIVVLIDYIYPLKDIKLFLAFIAILFLIQVFHAFLNFVANYLNGLIQEDFDLRSLSLLCNKLLHSNYQEINKRTVGDLTIRLTDDFKEVSWLMRVAPVNLITYIAHFGLFLFIAIQYSLIVTILALMTIPAIIIQTHFFSKKISKVNLDLIKNDTGYVDSIREKVENIKSIKLFNNEEKELNQIKGVIQKDRILSLKESLLSEFDFFTDLFTARLWGVVVTFYIGYQVIGDKILVGQALALSTYLIKMEEPIFSLANLYTRAVSSFNSAKRVSEVLQIEQEKSENSEKMQPSVKNGNIEVDKVSFSFDGSAPIIKNFTFLFKEGKKYALVGESGSGKSTLVNLLLGFYRPTTGSIKVCGLNLDSNPSAAREVFGVSMQNPSIFTGTIGYNISYGLTECSQKELEVAAKMARAHTFIKDLPFEYESRLGSHDDSVVLSGGQLQRIELARLFLKNAHIFIFDEPTSALDPENEILVHEAINNIANNKTSLYIAHKLSTLKFVDEILVLKRGVLVERGNFDELIQAGGYFYKLYSLQKWTSSELLKSLEVEAERAIRYDKQFCVGYLHFDNIDANGYVKDSTSFIHSMLDIVREELRLVDYTAPLPDFSIGVCFPETTLSGGSIVFDRICKRISSEIEKNQIGHGTRLKSSILLCDKHTNYSTYGLLIQLRKIASESR